jgi:hypothetical protein
VGAIKDQDSVWDRSSDSRIQARPNLSVANPFPRFSDTESSAYQSVATGTQHFPTPDDASLKVAARVPATKPGSVETKKLAKQTQFPVKRPA